MGPIQRDQHCSLAVTNRHGRCIACCHYNWKSHFNCDCTGRDREDEIKEIEQQIADRKKGLH